MPVPSVDDHSDTLFAARHCRIRQGPASVSEPPKVSGERNRVLGKNGEDGADDVAGKVWRDRYRAKRDDVRGDALQGVLQQDAEVHAQGAQAFPCLFGP